MTPDRQRLLTAVLATGILAGCSPAVPPPQHETTEQALTAADLIAAEAWAASGLSDPLPEPETTLIPCRDGYGASIELEYHRLDQTPEARAAVENIRRHWDSSPIEELFDGNRLQTRSNIDGFNTFAAWASGEPGLRIGLATTECYPDAPEALG